MASSVQEGLDAEQEYQEGSFNSSFSADDQQDDSNNNLKQSGDPQRGSQKEERLSRSQQAIFQDIYQTQQGQLMQQPRGATQRAGSLSGKGDMYQMKNQETIQRLAAKKRQEQEEKEKEAKRQKRREEKLRARMLAEAAKFRETKEKENPPTMSSKNIVNSNNDIAIISKNNTRKSLSAANENAKGNLNESNQSSHSNIHEINHSVDGIEGIEGLKELSQQQQQGQQLQQQYQNNQNLKQQGRRLKFKDVEQMYELVVVKGKYSRQQLTEQQAYELSEIEARINEERESLQKMQKVFRTRQITFLEELKRKQEQKKQEEELIKLKLEKKAIKLKEQYENVSSNIFAETEMSKLKRIEKEEDPNRKVVPRATSAEEMQYKEEKKETLKKIQQKNQEYIEKLKEKKLAEKLKEEEEKKKKDAMKERIKDFVLVNIKKEIENGTFFVDVPEKKPKKDHQKRKIDEIQSNPLASPKATLTPLSVIRKVEKLPKIKDPMKDTAEDGQNDDNGENEDGDDSGGSDGEGGTTESGVVKKKLRKYPFIVDLDIWKKKQRLPADTKVFIVTGGYHDIKKSLLKRGWVDNPDSRSPCFNLRWSLQTKDIDYESLKDFQIANHFQKSACITTKVGLTKSIRNLVWHDNVDIDAFFPRCYDLNDQEDFDNFVEEFKTSKAESILKRYMRMFQEKDPDIEKLKKQAVIALNVCERRIRDLDDIIDDPNCVHLVTKKEWNILSSDELSEEKLAQKKYDSWLERIEGKKKTQKKKKKKKVKAENEADGDKTTKKEGDEEDEEDDDEEEEPEVMDEFTTKVHAVLKKFVEKFSQDTLTGEDNIWIIKPAGLSRGRGITCYNNLVEILDHVKSKESQWVIQKYIENPLIIKKRKFDVRVWVLVTDWNPVTIWHFVDCYVRFSVDDYDTENLQNKFTHLTNNMISKLKQREEKDDISELGNMYFKENFIEFLKAKEGYDVFTDKIEPQMRHAIIMSLKSVQDTIENRKGSHEMYGYDFMIDDLYNTWLIEINSSPSMEYSTPVTERLVKAVSEDIVKVVVDYGMEKSKKARKDIDTGAFKKIYKGKYVEENSGTVGLALVCEGIAMKKKKNNTAKVTTLKPNFPPAS